MNLPFKERCLNFGVDVIRYVSKFPTDVRSNSRARQLEKSATSIGANVAEAQSAQSRADFLSKFEIALKEARETDYWLRIFQKTIKETPDEVGSRIGECWQITAILVASIKTAKRNGGIDEPRLHKGRAESREQN